MAERGLRGVADEPSRRQASDRGQPFDPEAERALLGAALLSADARRQAVAMVTTGDLWVPLHGRLWDAIVGLHRDGGHVDAVTVREWLDRHGSPLSRDEQAELVGVVAETPATSNVVRYARIVAELAALRRALLVGQDIVDGAYARPADVAGFLDRSRQALAAVGSPVADEAVTQSMADFLAAASPERDWVIPLMLERGERMLLIAGEGVGKAVLMRQLAIAAAQGVHPFMPDRRQPHVRSLLIDLENPADIIRRTSWRMERAAKEMVGADYNPDRCTVWHETAGIDLRSGADFAKVDEVLTRCRPDMVCHPAATRVLVAGRGPVPIEEVLVGDQVVTHTGVERTVTDRFARTYSGPMFTIRRMYRDRPIVATADHPLLVAREGNRRWLPASDVRVGDHLVEPLPEQPAKPIDGEEVWRYEPPVRSHKRGRTITGETAVKATPELCRLTGYYLAEGSCQRGCVAYGFHEDEVDYHDDVIRLHAAVFGSRFKTLRRQGKGRCVTVTTNGTVASQFFSSLGRGAHRKHLPDWLWDCSDDLLVATLVGLWRGDGWVDSAGNCGYGSVSERLAEDVRRGLLRLGVLSTIRCRDGDRPNRFGKRMIWQVDVKGVHAERLATLLREELPARPLLLERQRAFGRRPRRGPTLTQDAVLYPVRSIDIEVVTALPVFNLEVETDHSFLAEGVASHNCIGPLYKMFRKAKGESDEDAALDVVARLDDLRARHGFALVIEHHAPKGDARSRELVPFGSSVWMRWPEFGPALHVAPNTHRRTLLWGSWRPGRDERPWPDSMSWGTEWAWHFHWNAGPPTAARPHVEPPRSPEPPLSLAGF